MYDGPLIDCDVHHNRVDDAELIAHLPRRWQDFVNMPGNGRTVRLVPAAINTSAPEGTNKRLDTYPDNGGPPGSDYELLKAQLLDAYNFEKVVLTFDVGQEAAFADGDFALAMSRAMNDWSADSWLDGRCDPRLCGAILVPVHSPEQGAAEIRRAGANPKFVSALVPYNALGHPYGHPVYFPLYEAAAEMGLAIQFHGFSGEYFGGHVSHVSGGTPHNSRFDIYLFGYQGLSNHLTSMIVHGVFERFPDTKIFIQEAGLSWLPWFVASLESNYEQMRRESIWVRKHPSEYLHDHLFLTTQPCEATPHDRDEFVAQMSLVDGVEDMLCFSTDYPHWDSDAPAFMDAILPKSWHDKVFHENARRVLRLPAESGASRPAMATPAR